MKTHTLITTQQARGWSSTFTEFCTRCRRVKQVTSVGKTFQVYPTKEWIEDCDEALIHSVHAV